MGKIKHQTFSTQTTQFETVLEHDDGRPLGNILEGFYSGGEYEVMLNGKRLPLEPSLKEWAHSPTGFNWGYNGSGPAQLALAIALELTGKREGYQEFKAAVIAELPQGNDFKIEFNYQTHQWRPLK